MRGLVVVGISHLKATVGVRESLALPPERVPETLTLLRESCGLREAVILSTCSRFELYAAAEDTEKAASKLAGWLRGQADESVEPCLYIHRGPEAVRHLFRVAAGLDSWILGETEILGQVKDAYQRALRAGATSRMLNVLFQRALNAGKEVRTRTPIAAGVSSVGGAAALLAQKAFGGGGSRGVLVFGAGAMAASAVRHLTAKGMGPVLVANRTLDKAEELAFVLGGEAVPLEEAFERMADVDVAIFSTSSPVAIAGRAQLESAVRTRGGRPLLVIDIGVPRNVEPAARTLAGVRLYDIDDLKRVVELNQEGRRVAVQEASALLDTLVGPCWAKLSEPERVPHPAGGVL